MTSDDDHEAMGAMLYVGSRQERDYHREMVEELRAQNAKLREALSRLIDNVETGSYESECQSIKEARSVLADTE